jgi:hypothetical protein
LSISNSELSQIAPAQEREITKNTGKGLLLALLKCESEGAATATLSMMGLFDRKSVKRWVALGNMPNKQAMVHAQQSTAAAALVEKFTNSLDAILLRKCKPTKPTPAAITPRIISDIRRMSHGRTARFDRFGQSGKGEHPPRQAVDDKASSAS